MYISMADCARMASLVFELEESIPKLSGDKSGLEDVLSEYKHILNNLYKEENRKRERKAAVLIPIDKRLRIR